MDKKVKDYLDKVPSPQKDICLKVRKIILDTFPDIKETFENGAPWYECKFYLAAFKDHVNIGFSMKGLTQEEMSLFEGKGKYMRHIKLYSLEDVNKSKIVKLLKVIK